MIYEAGAARPPAGGSAPAWRRDEELRAERAHAPEQQPNGQSNEP
jgi:hypothetical protein